MAFAAELPAGMKASMLEDLLAGHRLEMPWFAGRVVRSRARHGIATPANDAVELALLLHSDGAARGRRRPSGDSRLAARAITCQCRIRAVGPEL